MTESLGEDRLPRRRLQPPEATRQTACRWALTRFAAERDGDRLAVQLSGAAAVPLEDAVPLPLAVAASGSLLKKLAEAGMVRAR